MFSHDQIKKTLISRGANFRTGDDGGIGQLQYHADLFNFVYSFGDGWEHVSVSTKGRCPTWSEMCMFKDIFWPPTEACVQFHPALADYVNYHEYCLHIWRPEGEQFSVPPKSMIGFQREDYLKGENNGA